MATNPDKYAETTDRGRNTDLISELLLSLQVSGGVLLNERYLAPWAISIPGHAALAEKLAGNPRTHFAAFHLVQRGSLEIALENGERHTAYEGEMLICYSGQAHTIYQGSGAPVQPFETFLHNRQNMFRPTREQEPQSTSLLCGVFQLQHTTRNPLFEALPPILKLSTRDSGQNSHPAIKTIIDLLLSELAHPSYSHEYVVGRYLELLCANSIGAYIESSKAETGSWLHAMKDPMVARVIGAVHSQPEHSWSVSNMAELSHLSPSRFAARFGQAMGMSPMNYVTQWRMYLAGKLLNQPQSNIENITCAMGYENVAAFSRAFRRTMGVSPGIWRTSHRAQQAGN